MKDVLNNRILIYIIIIIITLLLYYIVRVDENNIDVKSQNNMVEDNQIDDDINITSSELLNIKVSVEKIEEVILKNEREFTNLSKLDEFFIQYMDMKIRDVYKSIEFILSDVLPLSYKENNEFYITFYTIELKNFYKDNARYKRFFEVDSDYRDYLSKKYK